MGTSQKLINFDNQGWPIYAMSVRDIIEALGFELKTNRGKSYWEIPDDSPILDACPLTLEDDGMGYGVNGKFISSVSAEKGVDKKPYCNMFIDKEVEYVSVWNDAHAHPGQVVTIDGNEWILLELDETDEGMIFIARERVFNGEEDLSQLVGRLGNFTFKTVADAINKSFRYGY